MYCKKKSFIKKITFTSALLTLFFFSNCKKIEKLTPNNSTQKQSTLEDIAQRKEKMKTYDLMRTISSEKSVWTGSYSQNKGKYQDFEYIESIQINNNPILVSGNNLGYINHPQTQGIKTKNFLNITLTPGYTGIQWDENWIVWINGIEVLRTHGYGQISSNINMPEELKNATSWKVRVSMEWLGYPIANTDVLFGEIEDFHLGFLFGASGSEQVTINNNTSDLAYVIIYGYDGTNDLTSNPCYYDFEKQSLQISTVANLDLRTVMKEIQPNSSVTITTLPHINSGRVLISYKTKPIGPDAFEIRTTTNNLHNKHEIGEPGMTEKSLFDKFELTYDNIGITCNITHCDFFGIQFQAILNGNGTTLTSTDIIQNSGKTRTTFFNEMTAIPGWEKCIFNTNLRIFSGTIASCNAIKSDRLVGPDYYKPYVDYCWNMYNATNSLTIQTYSKGTFIGNTVGDKLILKNGSTTVTIDKPIEDFDIFGCRGVLEPVNNTPQGEIVTEIGAALNRSVFHLPNNQWKNEANHYGNNITTTLPDWFRTNQYAKLIHQYAGPGACIYAFPFDDVQGGNHSPLMSLPGNPNLTINLKSYN